MFVCTFVLCFVLFQFNDTSPPPTDSLDLLNVMHITETLISSIWMNFTEASEVIYLQ